MCAARVCALTTSNPAHSPRGTYTTWKHALGGLEHRMMSASFPQARAVTWTRQSSTLATHSLAPTASSGAHLARSGPLKSCRLAQLACSRESPSSYGGHVGGGQKARSRDDYVQALRHHMWGQGVERMEAYMRVLGCDRGRASRLKGL